MYMSKSLRQQSNYEKTFKCQHAVFQVGTLNIIHKKYDMYKTEYNWYRWPY